MGRAVFSPLLNPVNLRNLAFSSMLFLVFLAVSALPLPAGVDSDLFPGAADKTSAEVELAGIMSLYPGHILHGPANKVDPANIGRPPRIVELRRDVIYYMRIYDLNAALSEIATYLSKPGLILDLRYVTADAKSSEALAVILHKAGLPSTPVHGVGVISDPEPMPAIATGEKEHTPPVVLAMVNRQTSGPLEAWLMAFQEKEGVLAVGTPTAGQPATYTGYTDQPGYFIINGELRPESGSLVGTGLIPRFLVDVTPQQNDVAYFSVEHGTVDILNMLRQERTVTTTTVAAPTTSGNTTPVSTPSSQTAPVSTQQSTTIVTEARDPVLQRAVDVVAALQVLGRLPSSKDTGGAKPPATAGAAPAK